MTDDSELLRRYVQERSESAFAELVQRKAGLVYSAALRQVGGDLFRAGFLQHVSHHLVRVHGGASCGMARRWQERRVHPARFVARKPRGLFRFVCDCCALRV